MAELLADFFVADRPRPKGSWKFERGRARPMSEAEPAWSELVGWSAQAAYGGEPLPRGESVAVELQFRLKRAARRPRWRKTPLIEPSISHDLDKLTRSVFDALSGVIYVDDRQVVKAMVEKVYVDSAADEGVRVRAYAAGGRRFDDLWGEDR